MLAPIVNYRLLTTGHRPMSRSHCIFRDVPMDAWVDRYEKSHQKPLNRVFHTFGIPMIGVSIPLFLIAPLVRGFGKFHCRCFRQVWICQVLGHSIEGKPPEFLKRLAVSVSRTSLVARGCYAEPKPFLRPVQALKTTESRSAIRLRIT